MLNPGETIEAINKSCKILFTESTFFLHPSSANRFRISGNNPSKAINNYNNSLEEVTVIKWFENFWIYVDIRFENENTFISISVFQGEAATSYKHQLFRAEWDDYNSLEERHPQPHWHITANQVIEKTFEELAEMEEDSDTFLSLLNEEKSKIVDINKIHFAMCGNWAEAQPHVYRLDDREKIAKWFQGLLAYIREQLEYVS